MPSFRIGKAEHKVKGKKANKRSVCQCGAWTLSDRYYDKCLNCGGKMQHETSD